MFVLVIFKTYMKYFTCILIFLKNINLTRLITVLYQVSDFLLYHFFLFLPFICNIHIVSAKFTHPMFEISTESIGCHIIFYILMRQDKYLKIRLYFCYKVILNISVKSICAKYVLLKNCIYYV